MDAGGGLDDQHLIINYLKTWTKDKFMQCGVAVISFPLKELSHEIVCGMDGKSLI
jgi:hypothetical protein